jgi:hypothetical protein
MSVLNYQLRLGSILKVWRPNLQRSGSLKSRKLVEVCVEVRIRLFFPLFCSSIFNIWVKQWTCFIQCCEQGEGWTTSNGISITAVMETSFFLPQLHRLERLPFLLSNEYPAPGAKRPKREANHLPRSIAYANAGAYIHPTASIYVVVLNYLTIRIISK